MRKPKHTLARYTDYIAKRLSEGAALKQIARELGFSPSAIADFTRIRKMRLTWTRKEWTDETRAAIREMIEDGLSMKQIAVAMNLPVLSIRKWMSDNGIHSKSHGNLNVRAILGPDEFDRLKKVAGDRPLKPYLTGVLVQHIMTREAEQ